MVIAIVIICRQSQVVIAMLNTCMLESRVFTEDRRIYHGKIPVETSTCCVWELSSGEGEGGLTRGVSRWDRDLCNTRRIPPSGSVLVYKF